MNPLPYVLINVAILLLIHTGALQVSHGNLTQGEVVALYNYMSQILVELIKLANLIVHTTKALASASRISDALAIVPSQSYGTLECGDGSEVAVELSGVSLRYSDGADNALSDISFKVMRGQTVGIIGGTGSGKSSLISLIPRLYDVSDGCVLVGDTDVRDQDPSELRSRIGIVPQKAELFAGTIRSNLLWGNPEASEQDLVDALDAAQASEFVSQKQGQLDATVEQGGRNFSGGQKQRLSIARALVRKPDILILDDSASALDYATDAALRAAIASLPYHPTTFIVSQRTASVMHADRILVLEDGACVGLGTHAELLQTCPVYREIYDSQFKSEEVSANG
jgi:ABC-type multidrug transport system fused ATPase/permease subunit